MCSSVSTVAVAAPPPRPRLGPRTPARRPQRERGCDVGFVARAGGRVCGRHRGSALCAASRVSGHGAWSVSEHEWWAQLGERRACAVRPAQRSPRLRSTRARQPRCTPVGTRGGPTGCRITRRCTRPRTAGGLARARDLCAGEPLSARIAPTAVYAAAGGPRRTVSSEAPTAVAAGSRRTAVFRRRISGRSPSTRRRRRPSTRRWAGVESSRAATAAPLARGLSRHGG